MAQYSAFGFIMIIHFSVTRTHPGYICDWRIKTKTAAVAAAAVVVGTYSPLMRAPKNIFGAGCFYLVFTHGVNIY